MTSPFIVLIIDDDALLGRSLVRLAERTFPGYQCFWARDGVAGVELARQHAAQLRLVVLDIAMPRMDGNLAAVQIRTIAPRVPILPFSAYEQSWPMLLELGCVQPIRKHPDMVLSLGRLMRQALANEIAPLPDRSWIRAQRQSGNFLLDQAQRTAEHDPPPPEDQVQRALMWLDKYCGRFATPAREVLQARKLLREASARAKE
jgi:DNA-binding response OmpR family regulator